MIVIDGSRGEGGGQVLRSALTLSLLNQVPFRITNIRGRRKKPGLRAQHLASVRAAAAVGEAKLEGDHFGSQELIFEPSTLNSGDFHFEVGTAGSCSLVLQTIFLPLALAGEASRVSIEGGTHVQWSPTYEYIDRVWLPVMGTLGYPGELCLENAGFYPQGGGRIEAWVSAGDSDHAIEFNRAQVDRPLHGISLSSNLPDHVTERQKLRVIERLQQHDLSAEIELNRPGSVGRGSAVFLTGCEEINLFGFSALGARGKPAEEVADEAVDQMFSFLDTSAVVDRYLADQLLIPLSIASEPSTFTVEYVSQHLLTNSETIGHFLDAQIDIDGVRGDKNARIQVRPVTLS